MRETAAAPRAKAAPTHDCMAQLSPKKMSDLLDNIDLSMTHCLNEKGKGSWGHAIKQGYREQDGEHGKVMMNEAIHVLFISDHD